MYLIMCLYYLVATVQTYYSVGWFLSFILVKSSQNLLASQGNMVGRGVVEFCAGGPPVRINFH